MRHGSTVRRCSSISMSKSKKRQQSQRVHPTILRNTTIFRRHSRELKKKNIVDAVLAELEKRNSAATQAEEQRIEAEKREILDDLYLYGM